MNIVITGGLGHIGSFFSSSLLNKNLLIKFLLLIIFTLQDTALFSTLIQKVKLNLLKVI